MCVSSLQKVSFISCTFSRSLWNRGSRRGMFLFPCQLIAFCASGWKRLRIVLVFAQMHSCFGVCSRGHLKNIFILLHTIFITSSTGGKVRPIWFIRNNGSPYLVEDSNVLPECRSLSSYSRKTSIVWSVSMPFSLMLPSSLIYFRYANNFLIF